MHTLQSGLLTMLLSLFHLEESVDSTTFHNSVLLLYVHMRNNIHGVRLHQHSIQGLQNLSEPEPDRPQLVVVEP